MVFPRVYFQKVSCVKGRSILTYRKYKQLHDYNKALEIATDGLEVIRIDISCVEYTTHAPTRRNMK